MIKNLEAIRTTGQESLNRLVVLGKQQPPEVKTWGVTATAAVAGGIVLVATAQGVVTLLATLAAPPVALTVGALGGGVLGWLYVSRPKAQGNIAPTEPEAVATSSAPTSATAETGTGEVTFSETTNSEAENSKTTNSETTGSETTGVEPTSTAVSVPEISSNDSSSSVAVEPQLTPVNPLQVEPPSNAAVEETPTASALSAAEPDGHDGDANASLDTTRAGEPLTLTPEPVTASAPSEPTADLPPIQQDKLEIINGIGPVFAKRLHAAGIHTFAQLAAVTPEQLQELMAPSRGGQLIHAAEWIAQAQQLANAATD